MDWGNGKGKKDDRKDRKQKQGVFIGTNQGDGEGKKGSRKDGKQEQGVSIGSKREIVTTMGPTWFTVQSLLFSRGGLLGVVPLMRMVTTMTTTMMMAAQTYISPKLLSQPSGMTVFDFWISAESSLFPSSGPCQQIRGSRDAHLHPVFHRTRWYHSPVFPIPSWSYLVTGQIFLQ